MRHVRASGSHCTGQAGKMMRKPQIIVSQVRNQITPSLAQTFVIRPALMPGMSRQVYPSNARIADARNHFLRVISAGVTHDEHFEIPHRLPQHTSNRER
jgi:hypothetical protein